MARQLPAPRNLQHAIEPARAPASGGLSRLARALAPDLLRVAVDRLQSRNQGRERGIHVHSHPVEGVQLSEVEIDVSFPFVQRVTMRNATAWSHVPGSLNPGKREDQSGKRLRRLGLIGTSGALALIATVLARRIGPFSSTRKQIIDISGRTRE